MYEQALQASGHYQKLQFQQEQENQRRRTRKRNFAWFNPPYNDLVSTNVGKRFFYLLIFFLLTVEACRRMLTEQQ